VHLVLRDLRELAKMTQCDCDVGLSDRFRSQTHKSLPPARSDVILFPQGDLRWRALI
jgi:hypothetical protein